MRLAGDPTNQAETPAETELARDSASARDARERVKLVRAAMRYLDKGRVDRARIVLADLLDLLGSK